MVTSCMVYKCKSIHKDVGCEGVSFHRFPKVLEPSKFSKYKNIQNITKISSERRQKWIGATKRDLRDDQYSHSYVCSLHFKSGKKGILYLHYN